MTKQFISILLLTLSLTGCAGYKVHPGAPSTQASVAFDVLITADSVIKDARIQLVNGGLPQSAKPLLNDLINTYNTAKASLKAYSDALNTNQPADKYLAKLTNDLKNVQVALTSFKKGN